jgi:hypothetical protein
MKSQQREREAEIKKEGDRRKQAEIKETNEPKRISK